MTGGMMFKGIAIAAVLAATPAMAGAKDSLNALINMRIAQDECGIVMDEQITTILVNDVTASGISGNGLAEAVIAASQDRALTLIRSGQIGKFCVNMMRSYERIGK